MRGPALLAALLVTLAAPGCGAQGDPAWSGRNLLANPGFEQGRMGWSIRDQSPHWGDFRVVEEPVRSGRRAAQLRLHHGSTLPPRRVRVYGVVQELRSERLPDTVGGFYRVERWERGAEATDLYLQVVVVVWRPESDAPAPEARLGNRQLRYYLAGIDEPPFQLANARVQFVTRADPVLGVWQRFELPVRADFERLWGSARRRIGRIELLFEARWDNMQAGSAVRADVYYDDLFAGQDAPLPSGAP